MRPSTTYTTWMTFLGFAVGIIGFGFSEQERGALTVLAIGLAAAISAWLAGRLVLDRSRERQSPSNGRRIATALVSGTLFHPLFFILAGVLMLLGHELMGGYLSDQGNPPRPLDEAIALGFRLSPISWLAYSWLSIGLGLVVLFAFRRKTSDTA